MNAGQIVDMSELIDKYGTNIKQIYGEDIAKINQIEALYMACQIRLNEEVFLPYL